MAASSRPAAEAKEVLTGGQRNSIEGYYASIFDDICMVESAEDATKAFNALIDPKVDVESFKEKYKSIGLAGRGSSIEQARELISHPCPQNRTAHYPYVGERVGFVAFHIGRNEFTHLIDIAKSSKDKVVFKNGRVIKKEDIIRYWSDCEDFVAVEPPGLLNLTAWEDDKTPFITKETMQGYIRKIVQQAILAYPDCRKLVTSASAVFLIQKGVINGVTQQYTVWCASDVGRTQQALDDMAKLYHLDHTQTLLKEKMIKPSQIADLYNRKKNFEQTKQALSELVALKQNIDVIVLLSKNIIEPNHIFIFFEQEDDVRKTAEALSRLLRFYHSDAIQALIKSKRIQPKDVVHIQGLAKEEKNEFLPLPFLLELYVHNTKIVDRTQQAIDAYRALPKNKTIEALIKNKVIALDNKLVFERYLFHLANDIDFTSEAFVHEMTALLKLSELPEIKSRVEKGIVKPEQIFKIYAGFEKDQYEMTKAAILAMELLKSHLSSVPVHEVKEEREGKASDKPAAPLQVELAQEVEGSNPNQDRALWVLAPAALVPEVKARIEDREDRVAPISAQAVVQQQIQVQNSAREQAEALAQQMEGWNPNVEGLNLNPNEERALRVLYANGLRAKHLHEWQSREGSPREFMKEHADALIYLVGTQKLEPAEAIKRINGLDSIQASGLISAQLRKEKREQEEQRLVIRGYFGHLKDDQVRSLQRLYGNGLRVAHLLTWWPQKEERDSFYQFREEHVGVLVYLIKEQGVNPEQAIGQINRLNDRQAKVLQSLYRNGLRGDHLREWKPGKGSPLHDFSDYHAHALIYLIRHKGVKPAEAISRINGLDDAQAEKILLASVSAAPVREVKEEREGKASDPPAAQQQVQIQDLAEQKSDLVWAIEILFLTNRYRNGQARVLLEALFENGLRGYHLFGFRRGLFTDVHASTLFYLIRKQKVDPAAAIQQINGLVNGVQLIALHSLYVDGLRGEHLRGWIPNEGCIHFTESHARALTDLIQVQQVKPVEAVLQISGLDDGQAKALCALYANGLRGEHLRKWQPNDKAKHGISFFTEGHVEALIYLMKEKKVTPEKAIQQINKLDDQQAKRLVAKDLLQPYQLQLFDKGLLTTAQLRKWQPPQGSPVFTKTHCNAVIFLINERKEKPEIAIQLVNGLDERRVNLFVENIKRIPAPVRTSVPVRRRPADKESDMQNLFFILQNLDIGTDDNKRRIRQAGRDSASIAQDLFEALGNMNAADMPMLRDAQKYFDIFIAHPDDSVFMSNVFCKLKNLNIFTPGNFDRVVQNIRHIGELSRAMNEGIISGRLTRGNAQEFFDDAMTRYLPADRQAAQADEQARAVVAAPANQAAQRDVPVQANASAPEERKHQSQPAAQPSDAGLFARQQRNCIISILRRFGADTDGNIQRVRQCGDDDDNIALAGAFTFLSIEVFTRENVQLYFDNLIAHPAEALFVGLINSILQSYSLLTDARRDFFFQSPQHAMTAVDRVRALRDAPRVQAVVDGLMQEVAANRPAPRGGGA